MESSLPHYIIITPSLQDLLLDEEELGEKGKGQEEEEEGDPDALKGSHGAQYGGESELYYDQFELHSPVAKSHQIVLLEVSHSQASCPALAASGETLHSQP